MDSKYNSKKKINKYNKFLAFNNKYINIHSQYFNINIYVRYEWFGFNHNLLFLKIIIRYKLFGFYIMKNNHIKHIWNTYEY